MELLFTALTFFTSLVLVIIVVPPIIRVANAKKLFDSFNERKIHTKTVPPLGGVAIFIGLTLSSMIWTYAQTNGELKYILASVIILFFIGLKDDLMDIPARKKIKVQVVAALMMIAFGNIRFTHLHGIFGIGEINDAWSVILSLFAVLAIINAFNLIDGIDGLASGLAIVISTFFGIWFYQVGSGVMAILSFSLAGSLTGFFFYNVFGDKHKLFMGDTGSMVVGLVIAAMIIRFNEIHIHYEGKFSFIAAPAVSFALIAVPLVDTLRVMTVRVLQKRSPFYADKNHIHHRLLFFFDKHITVTLILVLCNVTLFVVASQLDKTGLSVTLKLMLMMLISVAVLYIPALVKELAVAKKHITEIRQKKSIFERIFFW